MCCLKFESYDEPTKGNRKNQKHEDDGDIDEALKELED